jgi:hypothetical protein
VIFQWVRIRGELGAVPLHASRPGFCGCRSRTAEEKDGSRDDAPRIHGGCGSGSALQAGFGLSARAGPPDKDFAFVAGSDLRVLDPIWTTAYITRNHGYMVFDTLFALDSSSSPSSDGQHYSISPDQLLYSFSAQWPQIS